MVVDLRVVNVVLDGREKRGGRLGYFNKEFEQVLRHKLVTGLGGSLEGIFVQLVAFGQLHRLSPSVVLLV